MEVGRILTQTMWQRAAVRHQPVLHSACLSRATNTEATRTETLTTRKPATTETLGRTSHSDIEGRGTTSATHRTSTHRHCSITNFASMIGASNSYATLLATDTPQQRLRTTPPEPTHNCPPKTGRLDKPFDRKQNEAHRKGNLHSCHTRNPWCYSENVPKPDMAHTIQGQCMFEWFALFLSTWEVFVVTHELGDVRTYQVTLANGSGPELKKRRRNTAIELSVKKRSVSLIDLHSGVMSRKS